MPEGDTIYKAARTLNTALSGKVVTRFESVLPKLMRVNDDTPIAGREILSVRSAGKWSVMEFSGDLFLLTHMLMNGSWHLYRSGEPWQRPRSGMRLAIETSDFVAVGFNVPIAEFHTQHSLARRKGFNDLGPDVLAPDFDPNDAGRRMRQHPDQEVGDVLIDQRVMAGLGNVFKSEICFLCGVNPFSPVRLLTDEQIVCLTKTAQKLMRANVQAPTPDGPIIFDYRRTTGRSNPAERLWVYGRTNKACLRCGTRILMRPQGRDARTTYWCPTCQPVHPAQATPIPSV
ncbi:MAG TPA: DNA-formamidopyrimidine glycosylase family protein [Nitrospiraceae bacterium]|nr:DNA-formamidopyrimidine glycosylase family protein [Nitrospiraceae bacterium]